MANRDRCSICEGEIVIQIFKNSGVCSGKCWKVRRDKEANDDG